jgi:hypothetical protein
MAENLQNVWDAACEYTAKLCCKQLDGYENPPEDLLKKAKLGFTGGIPVVTSFVLSPKLDLFKEHSGAKLDVGCGENKQPGWIGMDKRRVKGVDIVHDVQNFPWPVPDDSCFQVLLSHLWEHIEPKYRVDLMNELWRIVQNNGQLLLSAPYCMSMGAAQDPTHYPCPNEATFTYFDPDHPLYSIYKPKPWKLTRNSWNANGNIEVILEPRKQTNALGKVIPLMPGEDITTGSLGVKDGN